MKKSCNFRASKHTKNSQISLFLILLKQKTRRRKPLWNRWQKMMKSLRPENETGCSRRKDNSTKVMVLLIKRMTSILSPIFLIKVVLAMVAKAQASTNKMMMMTMVMSCNRTQRSAESIRIGQDSVSNMEAMSNSLSIQAKRKARHHCMVKKSKLEMRISHGLN